MQTDKINGPLYHVGETVEIIKGRRNHPLIAQLVGRVREIEKIYPNSASPYLLAGIKVLFNEDEIMQAPDGKIIGGKATTITADGEIIEVSNAKAIAEKNKELIQALRDKSGNEPPPFEVLTLKEALAAETSTQNVVPIKASEASVPYKGYVRPPALPKVDFLKLVGV